MYCSDSFHYYYYILYLQQLVDVLAILVAILRSEMGLSIKRYCRRDKPVILSLQAATAIREHAWLRS